MPISVCQNDSQACDQGELAIASAAAAQITKRIPLADSISKNRASGLTIRRMGALANLCGSSGPCRGAGLGTGVVMLVKP